MFLRMSGVENSSNELIQVPSSLWIHFRYFLTLKKKKKTYETIVLFLTYLKLKQLVCLSMNIWWPALVNGQTLRGRVTANVEGNLAYYWEKKQTLLSDRSWVSLLKNNKQIWNKQFFNKQTVIWLKNEERHLFFLTQGINNS